jgi:hypothetical protein
MSNSQCLPCYNTTFLKEECQGVGNGGQIFTRNDPSQQELSIDMQSFKSNHVYRQHLIHNGHSKMNQDVCSNINKTRCHYMNIPAKCGNSE